MATLAARSQLDDVFKALASEHRREIIRILGDSARGSAKTCCRQDEVCGCKLSDRLGLAASTISHHMSVLRTAGLVDARKEGVWTYYSLRRDVLEDAAAQLRKM